MKLGKEYTLVILLSAWGRSRDSKAKRNLSKQMWRILEPFGQVLVTIFLYFNLKTTTFFTNNICRIHTTWTGQICLRFGSFQDKLDCPGGMVSIQQIIFGEKKCTKLQFWYIIKSVLVRRKHKWTKYKPLNAWFCFQDPLIKLKPCLPSGIYLGY